jgi:hypothetical protein
MRNKKHSGTAYLTYIFYAHCRLVWAQRAVPLQNCLRILDFNRLAHGFLLRICACIRGEMVKTS